MQVVVDILVLASVHAPVASGHAFSSQPGELIAETRVIAAHLDAPEG